MSSVSILGSSRLVSLFSSVLCPLSILCLMITKIHRKLIETIDSDVVFGYLIANLVVKGVLSLELRPFFSLTTTTSSPLPLARRRRRCQQG